MWLTHLIVACISFITGTNMEVMDSAPIANKEPTNNQMLLWKKVVGQWKKYVRDIIINLVDLVWFYLINDDDNMKVNPSIEIVD